MSDASRQAEVERFVQEHLRSMEEIEILLLLYRSPARWWNGEEVATALHMTYEASRRGLERLSGAFFDVRFESQVCFRFSARNADRESLTERLDAAYHRNRSALLEILGRDRRAARDFADAFRLRKKEEE
jgi:hypothetical protein